MGRGNSTARNGRPLGEIYLIEWTLIGVLLCSEITPRWKEHPAAFKTIDVFCSWATGKKSQLSSIAPCLFAVPRNLQVDKFLLSQMLFSGENLRRFIGVGGWRRANATAETATAVVIHRLNLVVFILLEKKRDKASKHRIERESRFWRDNDACFLRNDGGS